MKRQRQAILLKMVREKKMRNQEDIVRELGLKGFEVTQTTVSRDIRELGLVKVRGREGEFAYRHPDDQGADERRSVLRRMASDLLLSAESTGNLVVVKTGPGQAQGLAAAIDKEGMEGVAGTVAGDDTIVIVCSQGTDSTEVKGKLVLMVQAA